MPEKNSAAVALGRIGGRKGGPARAASLTQQQRSESARRAVQARWAKAKGSAGTVSKGGNVAKKVDRKATSKAAPTTPLTDASRKALHLCLKRIKNAKDENELRRLTEELQKIVFHKQYRNAED
jgi:predicted nucleic acid-binding Zn ribbon protein